MASKDIQIEYGEVRRIEVQRYENGRVTIWLWGTGTLDTVRVFNTTLNPSIHIEVLEPDGKKTHFPAPLVLVEAEDD